MKSNIFFKVLGKTTIEIDESASEIIPKLCEQNGHCFEFDSEGRNFSFYCSKKGKIEVCRVGSSYYSIDRLRYKNSRRIKNEDPYRIIGKTREFNYKTIITLYSVKERGSLISVIVTFIIAIALAALCAYIYFAYPGYLPSAYLLPPALFILTCFFSITHLNSKNKNYKNDLEAMKQAAIHRIKATQIKEEDY